MITHSQLNNYWKIVFGGNTEFQMRIFREGRSSQHFHTKNIGKLLPYFKLISLCHYENFFKYLFV